MKCLNTSRAKEDVGNRGAASPYVKERLRWEKGYGGFPEQNTIGATVPSLSRVYDARKQHPDSSFVEFV